MAPTLSGAIAVTPAAELPPSVASGSVASTKIRAVADEASPTPALSETEPFALNAALEARGNAPNCDTPKTVDGITSAQMSPDMNLAQNWNEIAAPGTNLPGASDFTGESGRVETIRRPERRLEPEMIPGVGLTEVPSELRSAEVKPAAVSAPVVQSDQLVDGILREVHFCQRAQAESLSVTLRPDARTEIALRITVTAGQVQIHARCHDIDFTALSAHWVHLQQTLAEKNIRLDALSCASGRGGDAKQNAGSDLSGRGGYNGRSPSDGTQFNEPPTGPSRGRAPQNRASRSQIQGASRLESWA